MVLDPVPGVGVVGSLTAVALGVALGAGLVWYARSRGPRTGTFVCAIGLVVAAVVYLGFAVIRGAEPPDLGLELVGVALFGALSIRGGRAPLAIGLGWLAHVGWDVILHGGGVRGYVPAWYPPVCVGFDLLVAAYLIWSAIRMRPAPDAA